MLHYDQREKLTSETRGAVSVILASKQKDDKTNEREMKDIQMRKRQKDNER